MDGRLKSNLRVENLLISSSPLSRAHGLPAIEYCIVAGRQGSYYSLKPYWLLLDALDLIGGHLFGEDLFPQSTKT